MSILTRLRRAFTPERKSLASPDAALLAAFGLTETTSTGIVVSQAEALKVPVVANAIQLISEAVASLDMTVKRIEGQDEVDVPDHPLLALLRDEANDWTTGFELIRQIVRDALMNDAGGLAWVTGPGLSTPPYSQPGGSVVVPELSAAITAGNTDVRYAHLVEYGHSNGFGGATVPPHAFFWPGFRLGRLRALRRIRRAVGKAIKEVK